MIQSGADPGSVIGRRAIFELTDNFKVFSNLKNFTVNFKVFLQIRGSCTACAPLDLCLTVVQYNLLLVWVDWTKYTWLIEDRGRTLSNWVLGALLISRRAFLNNVLPQASWCHWYLLFRLAYQMNLHQSVHHIPEVDPDSPYSGVSVHPYFWGKRYIF
jgi:hypothetical protein